MKSLFVLALLFTASVGFSATTEGNLLEDEKVHTGMDITSANGSTICSDLNLNNSNVEVRTVTKGIGSTDE